MVTKVDIARALEVSHTCVSAVLNNTPNVRISEATRRRVLQQAKVMGYKPAEKSDKPARAAVICYILCDMPCPDSSYLMIVNALCAEAMQDRRHISFLSLTDAPSSLAETFKAIDDINPLAVVLAGNVTPAVIDAVACRQLPFVVSGVSGYTHDLELLGTVNAVAFDVSDAVNKLMRWFGRKGSHRVALSIGPTNVTVYRLILEAYRQAIETLGLDYDPALVQVGAETGGQEIFHRLGHLGVRYDGLFLASAGRASRALPYLALADPFVADNGLVGVIGPWEVTADLPGEITACGPKCADTGRAIYQIISAEIAYAAKRKRTQIVPCYLREGTGDIAISRG